jgi:hypothetical protein
MHTLNREELAAALEYWIGLPYALQLEAILSCSQTSHWEVATSVGEVRHWLTMIAAREQIDAWGASLYGNCPAISERDGDRSMAVVEHAWRYRQVKELS